MCGVLDHRQAVLRRDGGQLVQIGRKPAEVHGDDGAGLRGDSAAHVLSIDIQRVAA